MLKWLFPSLRCSYMHQTKVFLLHNLLPNGLKLERLQKSIWTTMWRFARRKLESPRLGRGSECVGGDKYWLMNIPITVMFWYGASFVGLRPSRHRNHGCRDASNPVLALMVKVPGSMLLASIIRLRYTLSSTSVGVYIPTTFPAVLKSTYHKSKTHEMVQNISIIQPQFLPESLHRHSFLPLPRMATKAKALVFEWVS